MFFNDRRKAKKAASATTKAQIAAMANRGTLRATTTSPGQRQFGRAERAAVKNEVARVNSEWGPTDQPGRTGSRADRYKSAVKKVDKAADVEGFDGPAYRKRDAQLNSKGKQPKRYLPKKSGK
jgi:hypothetical protein